MSLYILNENVYIYPPKGVKCNHNEILKLNKSLQNNRPGARMWKLIHFCWNWDLKGLKMIYFCLYTKKLNSKIMHLIIYVDDKILSGPDLNFIREMKEKLMDQF